MIEKAHKVGAQVLLNGYHSVGIIPVDVTALNVDFYIGGTLKWLCGGPGGVFMYVRPDLLPTLQPKITGWFAHAQPFAFEEQMELRDDAYRLANGTPAIAALYAIQPGVDDHQRRSASTLSAPSRSGRRSLIVELADEPGYEVVSPRDTARRAGTVTVRPPEAYAVSTRTDCAQYRDRLPRGGGHSHRAALLQQRRRNPPNDANDRRHSRRWQLATARRSAQLRDLITRLPRNGERMPLTHYFIAANINYEVYFATLVCYS